jgi:DNA-nicking Smr family endonuclease
MARRRGLTPDERRLWNQVAATAVPLRPSDAVPPSATEALPPSRDPPRPALPAPGRRPAPEIAADPVAGLERAHPQMDRRRFEKMRRGRMEPQARLDLHGMTSDRAHPTLTAFILAAVAREHRLVLVITGKGKANESAHQPRRHGILRHSLPHWLAAPPLIGHILQVAPAHQRHGGAGAFYVYLRRRR